MAILNAPKSSGTYLLAAALFCTVFSTPECAGAAGNAGNEMDVASREAADDLPDRWTARVGVSFLTDKDIGEVALGNINIADGPAGGEIYLLELGYRLHRFDWDIGRGTYHPVLELPVEVHMYDENGASPYFDYNAGLRLRWVDLPWNDYVKTSFAMGIGLSWTETIPAIDIERHPGRDRSRLKLHWPMEMTLAAPRWPAHQLVLFIEHQSGGFGLFDRGGINSLGVGYRVNF